MNHWSHSLSVAISEGAAASRCARAKRTSANPVSAFLWAFIFAFRPSFD